MELRMQHFANLKKKTVVSKFKEYKEFKVINWLPTKWKSKTMRCPKRFHKCKAALP